MVYHTIEYSLSLARFNGPLHQTADEVSNGKTQQSQENLAIYKEGQVDPGQGYSEVKTNCGML
jgi:hypothetical protein